MACVGSANSRTASERREPGGRQSSHCSAPSVRTCIMGCVASPTSWVPLSGLNDHLSAGQVIPQERIETLAGLGQSVVDLAVETALSNGGEELRQFFEVRLAEGPRVAGDLAAVFQVLDAG